jgi:hypothetical protein
MDHDVGVHAVVLHRDRGRRPRCGGAVRGPAAELADAEQHDQDDACGAEGELAAGEISHATKLGGLA